MRPFLFALLFSCWISTSNDASASDQGAIQIGSRRELFADDYLVDRLAGSTTIFPKKPKPREIVLVTDKPWEGSSCLYFMIFRDKNIYRMYYRGLQTGNSPAAHREVACYAESHDGITWRRPELNIVNFRGSTKNNIIWKGPGSHNFSPFIDQRPGCPKSERLKAFGGVKRDGGMLLFKSADGIHWKKVQEKAVITNGAFDSANLGFWDPTINKYRAYWRIFTAGITEADNWKPAGIRAIRTAVSDDLIHWEDEDDITYVDSPPQQMYTNNIIPYFRAPHILLGFPMRYVERGWSPSMRALPDPKKRELRAAAHLRYGTAITETQIMASRDGIEFKRWNEAFLPPGIQRPDSWYYAHNDVAWNMVTTKSSLPGAPNELSFYASSGKWHGNGAILTRHSLRQDGFVSASSPLSGGEMITRPLTFEGKKLSLNFATSAAGTIKVEIQTPSGQPINGFHLQDADETFGDELDRTVSWGGSTDVSKLAGQPVRLRITLSDADLYAVRFHA